jgi:hypothetical protein
VAVALATAVGALVRGVPVVRTDFPLNDGGLFAQMIRDLSANAFALPAATHYNGLDLPFAYPPLGLYVAAWLSQWIPVLDILHLVPLVVSTLTIPVAYLIYRRLLPSEAMALIAAVAFAVMPRSYNWQIAGGGITRSFGFLFGLLAILAGIAMYQSRSRWWPMAAGIALGLSLLSHPQAALFATVSVALLISARTLSWRVATVRLAMAIGIAAIVIAPWLITVLGRYGFPTFLGAAQTGGNPVDAATQFFTFRFSDGLVEVLGFAGGIGLFICALNRKWLWVAWSAIAFVLGARAGLTYATLPVAGAIAWGVADGFRWLRLPLPTDPLDLIRPKRAATLTLVLLVAALLDSIVSPLDARSPLRSISPSQLQAMEWVAGHTTQDARVLVVAGLPWEIDAIGEWFWPLTHRRSVATVQGSEWLGPGKYATAERRHYWMLNCVVFSKQNCAAEWSRVVEHVDLVFLTDEPAAAAEGHPCCLQLADRILRSGGELLYDAGGVRILRMGDSQTRVSTP